MAANSLTGEHSPDSAADPASKNAVMLEQRLTLECAPRLVAALRERRGCDLELDASLVETLSTPCVQVILAAGRTWRSDGYALRITAFSDVFLATLWQLGLKPDDLLVGTDQ